MSIHTYIQTESGTVPDWSSLSMCADNRDIFVKSPGLQCLRSGEFLRSHHGCLYMQLQWAQMFVGSPNLTVGAHMAKLLASVASQTQKNFFTVHTAYKPVQTEQICTQLEQCSESAEHVCPAVCLAPVIIYSQKNSTQFDALLRHFIS